MAPTISQPLVASWEPNFRSVLPRTGLCIAWIFLLCLTLPSRSQAWRLTRLASFPAVAMLAVPITFDRQYTLGNPLRDLALPTITWTIMCKAVEICIVYSKGGPRPIRPFLPKCKTPVQKMEAKQYAEYEWKGVDYPEFFSWARIIYGLDVLGLRRVGTSPILSQQGRALGRRKASTNGHAISRSTKCSLRTSLLIHQCAGSDSLKCRSGLLSCNYSSSTLPSNGCTH